MKLIAVTLFALSTAAAECCDSTRHAILERNSARIKLCTDRGGVPSSIFDKDGNGHAFEVLVNCAFPCTEQKAEKP